MKAGAFVAVTIGIGGVVLAVAVVNASPALPGMLALLAGIAFLTELIHVPRDEDSFDPRDTTAFTFSGSVHIAAVLLLGPWEAALVAMFGVVASDALRGRALKKIGFNASVLALGAAAGGLVFQALGGEAGALDFPGDFPAIAGLSAVVFGVGALFVSVVVALDDGIAVWSTVRESIQSGFVASVGEAAVGVAFATFIVDEPWATVSLLPLVFAVYRSHERLVTLRRETAHALETFATVVDERDPYTYRHSDRVAEHVRTLAEAVGLPGSSVARLRWAGRLHDLGKIAVDTATLQKPGRLDEDEFEVMRRHPRLSARLLRRFRLAADQAQAVEYHHERADGNGYYGIAPTDVPLGAHFLIVADSFDAMVSDRPYRKGLPVETALAEIERCSGTQFHPAVAKAFVALQRGLDPVAALAPEELAEIRRLAAEQTRHRIRLDSVLTPGLVQGTGLLAALAAFGLGMPLLIVPALGVAAAGMALNRLDAVRARRLATDLREALSRPAPPDVAFDALVSELADACELRWAAVVRWSERESNGMIERESVRGALAPGERTLISWLARETGSRGVLDASGAELGRTDRHVAVPLRHDDVVAGYLVLAVGRPFPRRAHKALAACAEDLAAQALLPPPVTFPSHGLAVAV